MYRFKKVCFWFLVPLILVGCSTSKNRLSDWMQENNRIKILSTTAQIGDLVSTIGGDRIDGWVLIQGDLDPHSYELVKGDLDKISRADLIFYNGLGLEHGASLSHYLKSSPNAIPLGDKIKDKYPGQILTRGATVDPHIWMDISLWQKAIDPIVETLTSADPEGAEYYRERGEALAARMETAHLEVQKTLQEIPSVKRYLVTSHDAFHYFTRTYLADPEESDWEGRFAAPEGLAPEGQLNPRDIQKIIDFLRVRKISVLFPETNVSKDSIQKIATAGKEFGLDIQICKEPLYGDAMSGLAYLEMMHHNANTIARHLCTP